MKAFVLILSLVAAASASALTNNPVGIIDPPRTLDFTVQSTFEDGIVRQISAMPDYKPVEQPIVPFEEPEQKESGPDSTEEAEFNPYAPGAEEQLKAILKNHPEDFDAPKYADSPYADLLQDIAGGCSGINCRIYVRINLGKLPQQAHIYIDGVLTASWLVSGGTPGRGTRPWNGHPGGYITKAYYDSSKYPAGDYMGLGNMPYAMFYSGGFALHGTPQGSWSKLGRPASHGCVRMHPDNAKWLNKLVRQVGRNQTWFHITR